MSGSANPTDSAAVPRRVGGTSGAAANMYASDTSSRYSQSSSSSPGSANAVDSRMLRRSSAKDGGRSKDGGGRPRSRMLLPRLGCTTLAPVPRRVGGTDAPSLAMYSLLSASSMSGRENPTDRNASGATLPLRLGGKASGRPRRIGSSSTNDGASSPNDGGRWNAGGGSPISFMLLPRFLSFRRMPLGGTGGGEDGEDAASAPSLTRYSLLSSSSMSGSANPTDRAAGATTTVVPRRVGGADAPPVAMYSLLSSPPMSGSANPTDRGFLTAEDPNSSASICAAVGCSGNSELELDCADGSTGVSGAGDGGSGVLGEGGSGVLGDGGSGGSRVAVKSAYMSCCGCASL